MKILSLILALLSGFTLAQENRNSFLVPSSPPYELWKFELDSINYADGIDYREAKVIIKNFDYTDRAVGCGATGIIVDYGVYWKVATFVGFAASKGDSIFIHKKKGRITQNGEILFVHPSEMIMVYPKALNFAVPISN